MSTEQGIGASVPQVVIDALSLAGHGLHPADALLLARHYLDAPALPGTVITASMVRDAIERTELARERRQPR